MRMMNEQLPRSRRRAAGAIVVPVTALLLLGAMGAGSVGDLRAQARAALEQYVETRRIISEEKRDWALGREMLDDRIDLVRREIESLREKIGRAEASIAEADTKRGELLADNERQKATAAGLEASIGLMEDRTRALLGRLPETLREKVAPLSQRLPKAGEPSGLSLSERFQNVVGVLNEINKFHREITVTSEVRDLPDGTTAEVTVMYVGISQAYYVNGDGTTAGVGSGGADGWIWKPADAYATEIAQAISIRKNEGIAAFVPLPLAID